MKTAPTYAVASVDHALRLATMLQLEGTLSVAQAAERLGVARSTAHRLLQMLVYRDFAVQDDARIYHAGPVLQLATHSRSQTSRLRSAAMPHLDRVVEVVGESANLTIRTGTTARFIASVECSQTLRVGSREGMVFPAHRSTGGLLLLAELPDEELRGIYAEPVDDDGDPPELAALRKELAVIRAQGFVVNQGRSERGVVAVGVPVRDADGNALAGLSISMPEVRYEKGRLPRLVATLNRTAGAIEASLTA
ncbi:IclR family transcriptional regulator [Nocardioides marmotae]|uniref:IclR family transcriptional regulator n=1 Tax=Nocardioides marmotae TaxID=2663857 RepID=UPI0012B65C54|nr:IclR family transcriptional regulator [Nocardioides marmotae]MBC9731602.1 IclR family transcriptional regulator [Nocardioides marmotae]MTB82724.1 helix-turn-helix domain-containing protein [Nocardioides marmotae]